MFNDTVSTVSTVTGTGKTKKGCGSDEHGSGENKTHPTGFTRRHTNSAPGKDHADWKISE